MKIGIEKEPPYNETKLFWKNVSLLKCWTSVKLSQECKTAKQSQNKQIQQGKKEQTSHH